MSENKQPAIPTTPVKSSNIAGVGHDPSTNTLAVQFKGSGTYHFQGVPAELFTKLQESESVGKFFHANIRGKFESEKLIDKPKMKPCFGCRHDPSVTEFKNICAHPHQRELFREDTATDSQGYPLCYREKTDDRADYIPAELR